jgi:hypothetical protein
MIRPAIYTCREANAGVLESTGVKSSRWARVELLGASRAAGFKSSRWIRVESLESKRVPKLE